MKRMRPSRRRPNSAAEGLLDLQHEVGAAPHVVDRPDPRADGFVGRVGKRAAFPRALLDDDLVALLRQLARARGGQGHAVLVGLDLLGDADLHGAAKAISRPRSPRQPALRHRRRRKTTDPRPGRGPCGRAAGRRMPPPSRSRPHAVTPPRPPGTASPLGHPTDVAGDRKHRLRVVRQAVVPLARVAFRIAGPQAPGSRRASGRSAPLRPRRARRGPRGCRADDAGPDRAKATSNSRLAAQTKAEAVDAGDVAARCRRRPRPLTSTRPRSRSARTVSENDTGSAPPGTWT